MNILKLVYWVGLVGEIIIRAPYQKTSQAGVKTERRESSTEKFLLGLLTLAGLVFPLIYSVTNWFGFANYSLPAWLGWLGIAILTCALIVFARGHADLRSNWSPTLEIRKDHTLISAGIYRFIRHPMYASQLIWSLAQILLLQNWLAGPIALIVFIPFYFLRVQAEEKMMLDTFGDQYRAYIKTTGGIIPKW